MSRDYTFNITTTFPWDHLDKHMSLHWRHNDHDSVSNHQPHGCLLNRLFRRRSKKTSKLRVTGLCVGNSPGPVNFPHKGPVTRKMSPFGDVIMSPIYRTHRVLSCSCMPRGLFSVHFEHVNMLNGISKVISLGLKLTLEMLKLLCQNRFYLPILYLQLFLACRQSLLHTYPRK